jgi:hypothetical protein
MPSIQMSSGWKAVLILVRSSRAMYCTTLELYSQYLLYKLGYMMGDSDIRRQTYIMLVRCPSLHETT